MMRGRKLTDIGLDEIRTDSNHVHVARAERLVELVVLVGESAATERLGSTAHPCPKAKRGLLLDVALLGNRDGVLDNDILAGEGALAGGRIFCHIGAHDGDGARMGQTARGLKKGMKTLNGLGSLSRRSDGEG